ncbi:MAG: hypothetical protein U9R21_04715 [Candidatus Thermoplasmatota archaeon]|nr:hypothetical protein [Candidatus Thermoplasmatota archaeon]
MRKKTHLVAGSSYIPTLLTLIVALSIFVPYQVNAQEKQLIIDVAEEVYESENFSVSVYDPNLENVSPYLINVLIEFNGEQYNITENDENREITLAAPQISKDAIFTITASKTGYNSAITNISVIRRETQNESQLVITPDGFIYTIDANKQFSVRVTNKKTGNPIPGATVGIQSYTGKGSVDKTDDNGRACLIAPEDCSEIFLIAQKEGYADAEEIKIWVNVDPGLIERTLQNPYASIAIAVIVLIFAIMFVNFRQKRSIEPREKPSDSPKQFLTNSTRHKKAILFKPSKQPKKTANQHGPEKKDYAKSRQGAKVEEIRISRSRKDRETSFVSDEEKRNTISRKSGKKTSHDWFEGTDDIRYEIDKMTGEIDEEGKDKWFEGTDNIRAKIDEKLKKKDKKKEK